MWLYLEIGRLKRIKNELSYKGGTLIQLLLGLSYSEEETVEMCLHTQKRS